MAADYDSTNEPEVDHSSSLTGTSSVMASAGRARGLNKPNGEIPIELICQLGSGLYEDVRQILSNGGDIEDALDDDNATGSWLTAVSSDELSSSDSIQDAVVRNRTLFGHCEAGFKAYTNDSLPKVVLVIVASVLMVALTFTQRRRYAMFGSRYDSYPAMLRPFPVIEPCRMRFTFAAFWATVAYEGLTFISNPKDLIIQAECLSKWVKPLILLVNVHLYAILYFPIIGGMSTDTPLGYMIATSWIWVLTVLRAFDIVDTISQYNSENKYFDETTEMLLDIFSQAVPIVFMLILCAILPFRLVKGLAQVFAHFNKSMYSPVKPIPPYACTAEGKYVRELFTKKKPQPVLKGLKALTARFKYQNVPHFRYSQTVVSAATVGLIFIYYIIFIDCYGLVYVSKLLPLVFKMIDTVIDQFFDKSEIVAETMAKVGENYTEYLKEYEETAKWYQHVAKVYVWGAVYANIAAVVLVTIIQLFLLGNLLPSYRDDMLRAYRGSYRLILHPKEVGPRGIIGSALRYLGFQGIMFAWGAIIQLIVFTFIGVVIGYVAIIPAVHGFGSWLIDHIVTIAPTLAVTIVLIVIQMLVVAFCFAYEPCGTVLAVKNPRGYSNFVYLSFYKNIFIGIVGALVRLLLSFVTGAVVFSRLDMPSLTPKLRLLDSGFKVYEGLIHIENAHLNPTMITFANILIDCARQRRTRRMRTKMLGNNEEDTRLPSAFSIKLNKICPAGSSSHVKTKATGEELSQTAIDLKDQKSDQHRKQMVVFRWFLYRTLLMNPKLAADRKPFLLTVAAKKDGSQNDEKSEQKTISV